MAPLHARSCILANLLVINPFQIESKSLGPDFTILHAALEIIQSKYTHMFLDIIFNCSFEPRRLPKHMFLAHSIAPLSFIVRIDEDEQTVGIFLEETGSTIAAVHQKQREN